MVGEMVVEVEVMEMVEMVVMVEEGTGEYMPKEN